MDDSEKLKSAIAIWERSIDTQKHFNDLSLRTRQLGVTIVGATLGVGFVINDDVGTLAVGPVQIPMLAVLCFVAAAMMHLTRTLDINVYHRLLRGAVAFNEEFERSVLVKFFPPLSQGLSEVITVYSRYRDARPA